MAQITPMLPNKQFFWLNNEYNNEAKAEKIKMGIYYFAYCTCAYRTEFFIVEMHKNWFYAYFQK